MPDTDTERPLLSVVDARKALDDAEEDLDRAIRATLRGWKPLTQIAEEARLARGTLYKRYRAEIDDRGAVYRW